MSEGLLSVVGAGDARVLPGEVGLRDAGGLRYAGGLSSVGGLTAAGGLSSATMTASFPPDGGQAGEGASTLSSAALPWAFGGFTKVEPEFSVWNPESWRPAAKRGVDALLRKGEEALKADRLRRRAGALDALCLRGKDPVFDKRIGEFPELAYILKAAERGSETFHHLIGYEAAALGNGDAYGLASRLIDSRPERERGALRQKLSACKNERDGYVFVGKLIDVSAGEGWQELLRKREEFQKGLDLFGKELLETLPRCVRAGGSLPPALLEKATRYGDAETILAAHKKASAAFEQVKSLNRGGMSEGVFAARVQLRAEALEKEFYGSLHFGWPGSIHVPTREEYEQQARSDLGKDIAISREQMAGVLDLLRDADGRVDPRALAAFKLAVVAEMADQQTIIESKFWRNFGEGVADYVKNSSEFVERTLGPPRSMRYVPAAGGLASGVWMPEFDAERGARARAEWERMYKDPNVNAFVDFLRSAESVRLSASDAAGELTILLSDLGTVVGENAIPLGISALTGGGVLMAAATYAPMGINREIDSAYADGKSNPELYGWIVGGAGAVAEGSFGVATRGLPIVGRVAGRALDKAALRMMDVPVLGRALGAVQSRGYLRYAVSGALETSGELVGENYIAQALSYPAIEVLRACGADLDRAVFNPWEVSREGLMNERQVAATGTYCFLLGLLHAPAQHRAAVDFSRDRRHLLAAGLTERSASSLAAEAELIGRRVVEATMKGGPEAGERLATELEQGFAERSFSLFDREVIQESTRNPEALRDRLARENGLFMSQVDAEAAYREGVLQVALREMGVLSTERTLSGKNVVVFVDEKRAAEDRKGWKDGVAPEGYESPLRREEWTDDQLLAYAQVAFDQSATRRMKTIRSAALALDMAERINEGEYAGTIPLTRAGAHVTEVLKKNGGRMNAGVMKALAEAAYKEGEAGRELLPGVDNVVLQGVGRSFVKRLEWEGRHGDASLAARILSGEGGAGAVRVNASSGPASRILMNPGTTLSLHLAEDAVESMLVQKLRDEGGLDEDGAITPAGAAWLAAMHDEMLSVRAQILAATGKDVMPGLEKAKPGLQSVTEYFSHLAQSSFYQNADETNLSPEAARHVRYMDSALMQAKFLNDMGAVYASWSRTPAGERWLSEGGSLAVLLESAGHELHRLYSQSTLTHENVASVEEARRAAREAEGQGVGVVSASAAPDAAAASYGEAGGFAEASGFALADGLKENIELATANRLKARTEIPLCTVPRSLVALGERDAGIVTSASVIKKLKNKHGFSDAQIYELVEKLDDPLLVMSDREHSYMFLLDMTATNNRGVESPVISALSIRKDGGHFVLSAYALDSMQKVEEKLRRGELVYSRYSQGELRKQQEGEAAASSNHAPGLLPDLVRLLVGHGFQNNPITRADLVKRPTGERMENESGFALADGLKEKIELATTNRLGNGVLVPLCNMPRALQALGERSADIAARGSVLKKLKNKHSFSDEQIYELIEKLDDPLLIIRDSDSSYIFLLEMQAANNKGENAPVMAALSMKQQGEHLLLSGYALDYIQKIGDQIRNGRVAYSRYKQEEIKEAAAYHSPGAPGMTPDLLRWLAGHGFQNNPITRADLVKRPSGERLENESGFALADGLKEKIELAMKNRLGNGVLVPLCNMPRALQALGERTADIAARGSVLKKLKNKHGFSDEQIYELIEMLDDPLMVMSDRAHSYMFLLDMTARNNKKADAPVMVAVSIKKENEHLMLSAYALDSMQKVEEKLRRGELVYSRYSQGEMQKEAATYLINHVPGITPDLVRLTAGHGFRNNPITRADLVKRPTAERLEDESGFALADEATGDAGGSSASGRYRVNNDRVGLARHLDDKVEPVEIRFTPEQRGTKDWMNEAKAYIREYLAGKTFDIGRTGKKVYFGTGGTVTNTAAKGVRTQKRAASAKKLDEVIARAFQLSQEIPQHKEGESRKRQLIVNTSDRYETFGAPVRINGHNAVVWFGAFHKKGTPDDRVVFYEFGLAEKEGQKERQEAARASRAAKKAGEPAVVQTSQHETGVYRTTGSPAPLTLGEALREVNGKIKGMPEITLAGGELPRPALEADPGASATFSLLGEKTAERELPGIRGCIDALAEGKEGAEIHNAAWGHTITVPRGRVGKKGYGVDHMQEKRMLHGFTPDEAAFITVCAMKAAESVAVPKEQGNALWFEKFGVRAVVSNNDSQRGLLLTGYVWGTRGKNKAVDSEAATLAEHFYALDDLSRNRHVGAALKRALSRFETIVKQNPRTWESVIEHEIAKLRVKQNSKQEGSFMREADGRKTTLSEEEWLTMQTGALDSIGEGRKGGPGNDGGRPEGRYGSTSSFSLIGEHAATWEEHKRRAFTGRADGKARAELDASQARLAAEVWQRALEQKTPEALPLGRLMEFPELYAAYPELAELPVRVTSELGRTTAGSLARDTVANRQTILLNAALKPEAVLPTLLHEVQHAVQKLEGFAPGGTFLDAYDVYARRLNAMIDELEGAGKGGRKVPSRASAGESLPRLSGDIVRSVAELNELLAALDVWKGKRAERVRREAAAVGPRLMELYRNMPGEVEARRVAERLGLSAEERARQPFEEGGQGEKVAQPARAPEAAKATQEPPRQVRAAESRDRDALDERRSSGLKPKKRTGKDQANGSRDEAPLAEEVGLISEKQALKRLSRRYEVRDRQKRRVRFGNKTKGHLGDKDKDRSNRYRDLLLAEDTVKTGRCKGDYRRHYGKVYRDASGKEFGMLVIVVKDRAGKDEVLNFMRKTPASKLWKGVEQNDKK